MYPWQWMAPHVSETFRKQSPAWPLYLTLVSEMDPVKELYAPRPSHRPVFDWLKYVNGGKRPGRGSLIKNRSLRPYLVVSAPPTEVLNIQSETPPPTYVDTDIIHIMKWARQKRIEWKIYSRTDIISDRRLQRSKHGSNCARLSEQQDMLALG